ncbi:hypothetical protein ACIHCQ_19605 [Streptomyces sp. NPDC052236]|uniref:hypothetical protein n=1 Tax=Streptomyces sp. NPDC052236 TaxID=3365686 RepID=UPI0037CDD849
MPALAAPAHAAANSKVYVTPTWATAVAGWTWRFDRLDPVGLSVQDTRADGHFVGIQLVTVSTGQGTRYWPMHTVTTGSGTGLNRETYADTGGFPTKAWIRVCKIKGSTIVTCEESDIVNTPINDDY